MDADAWIDRLARELGVPAPSERERAAILDLAGTAAHASERRAAPIACWIAAAAGRDPEDALALAQALGSQSEDGSTGHGDG